MRKFACGLLLGLLVIPVFSTIVLMCGWVPLHATAMPRPLSFPGSPGMSDLMILKALIRWSRRPKRSSVVNVRNPSSELSEKLALVEFERCVCTRMGTPNDDVLRGHRLYGK